MIFSTDLLVYLALLVLIFHPTWLANFSLYSFIWSIAPTLLFSPIRSNFPPYLISKFSILLIYLVLLLWNLCKYLRYPPYLIIWLYLFYWHLRVHQLSFLQCLPFSWTTLRGTHCWHPDAVMGVVDTYVRAGKIGMQKSFDYYLPLHIFWPSYGPGLVDVSKQFLTIISTFITYILHIKACKYTPQCPWATRKKVWYNHFGQVVS